MYKPKETESELIIYQKYIDLVEYGYNLLIKYPKTEKYALHPFRKTAIITDEKRK